MAVFLNHTIVAAHDNQASADFLAEILNLPTPKHWGPFVMVHTNNDVSLDYKNMSGTIHPQHYAFLVTEAEFDESFKRIQNKKLTYWADPEQAKPGEINHWDGGRGVYFEDPDGHLMELITRPYGDRKERDK